jgi:hypothetical protein
MRRTSTYHDLLEAFRSDGCPVCRLALDGVRKHLAAINYEAVNDPQTRDRLRDSRGFCNLHAHQWLGIAHVLSTATLYEDLVGRLHSELGQLSAPRGSTLSATVRRRASRAAKSPSARRVFTASTQCPACETRDQSEAAAIRTLVDAVDEPVFANGLSSSAGLCLPHLDQALGSSQNQTTFNVLRDVSSNHLIRLRDQLREIIRKHDHRFTDEPVGDERGAAERAVVTITGGPGLR